MCVDVFDALGLQPDECAVEVGCGSGAITRHIMTDRASLASYTGVEIDADLVEYLKRTFPKGKFIATSADDLTAHIPDGSIDTVICSLPWTLFAGDLQESITREIIRVLKPGGKFTTFLCLHSLTYLLSQKHRG